MASIFLALICLFGQNHLMVTLSEWLPLAALGGTFTTLGLLKVYGFGEGIVGGGGKPVSRRCWLGRCPSWSNQTGDSRSKNH